MGRMLNIKEVALLIGMSRDFIYDRIGDGRFPPGSLYGRCRRWAECDILKWQEGKWRRREAGVATVINK